MNQQSKIYQFYSVHSTGRMGVLQLWSKVSQPVSIRCTCYWCCMSYQRCVRCNSCYNHHTMMALLTSLLMLGTRWWGWRCYLVRPSCKMTFLLLMYHQTTCENRPSWPPVAATECEVDTPSKIGLVGHTCNKSKQVVDTLLDDIKSKWGKQDTPVGQMIKSMKIIF